MGVKTNEDLEADYVIVGGGTSSLVLAARLPEDDRFGMTLLGSEADWQLITTPQTELGNRAIKEPQGKLLGSSSGINGQAFIAPSKAGIDAWSKLCATDWTWEKLSPYYEKSYTLQLPDEAAREHIGVSWVDQKVNWNSGPINVSFPAVLQDPLSKAWVDTFKEIGYSLTANPFSGNSIGGYSNLAAVDYETKTQSYAVTGYGLPAMQRPGVRILTKAMVQKILFDASDARVTATGGGGDCARGAIHYQSEKGGYPHCRSSPHPQSYLNF
ncbi:glucose-methanol-choline oxidoreductase [Aspergillus transmontanensis]|uniref:glucose oxidase n=1 Tax=Aspergillus transmontanensis TaxID=1034304 RepID=A0A5N6VZ88_9EURO|nr:glucose-methanol-choline oxidoreductase [Aspergillus transmontanensis]